MMLALTTFIVTFVIFNLLTSRIFFVYKIFLYFRLRRNINKMLPVWWNIKSISYVTMRKIGHKQYEAFISVKSLIDETQTNDYINFDNKGNIVNKKTSPFSLLDRIGLYDSFVEPQLLKNRKKELLRNESFKELGL